MTLELSIFISIAYLLLFWLSIKYIEVIPVLPMFLITFGFSLISRPFLSLAFPELDIEIGGWIYWGAAPSEIVEQALFLVALFLLATLLSFLLRMRSKALLRIRIQENLTLERVSIYCLLLTAPIYIYRGFVLWQGVNTDGYLATYTGDVKAALWINIGTAIFQVAYYFFLASFPKRRNFYIISSVFLFTVMTSLGTGQRGEFVTSVLFVIFASFYFKFNRFSILKLALAGFGLIILSVIIDAWRFGNLSFESFILGFTQFAWNQGISFFTIVGALEYRNEFSIFEGLLFPNKFISCDIGPYFTGEFCNNSMTVVNTAGIWWQKLTYILDPIKFGEGGGLGGSIVAALYLMFNLQNFFLSSILFFGVSMIFWKYVIYLHRWVYAPIIVRVYALFSLHAVIFIPRAALDYLIPHPRLIAASIFIFFFYLVLSYFSIGINSRSQVQKLARK